MAIQLRRGIFDRFDPTKLLPGEVAVVTSGDPSTADGRSVYICFSAGNVKRLIAYEDIAKEIANALEDLEDDFADAVREATESASAAAASANSAASAASSAAERANVVVASVPELVEQLLEDHPEWTTTVQDGAISRAKLASDLTNPLDRLMYRLSNMLTATPAEAEVVTVADAAQTPMAGLTLYGKSTQDGTPTPDAPAPIESVTGDSEGNISLWARGFNQCSIVRDDIFINGATSKIGGVTNGATAVLEVFPNTDYCLTYTGGNRCIIAGVDSMTPAVGDDARFIFNTSARTSPKVFNTGDNRYVACFIATIVAPASDICINLSDPARNGTYAPYTESVIPIPLDGHELRSLPDGTRDEVTVDERGHAVLVQRVQLTTQAVTDGVTGTVGVDVMSSTGAIVNGATVLYKLATPVTHDLGTIDPVQLVGPDLTAQAVPSAPFALTYERDLNTTLARLESAIATLA